MDSFANGTHYNIYRVFEKHLHAPYDYAGEGLLKRNVSSIISESTNPVLRTCYDFIERSMITCLKYVDRLQNFYNVLWRNR